MRMLKLVINNGHKLVHPILKGFIGQLYSIKLFYRDDKFTRFKLTRQ